MLHAVSFDHATPEATLKIMSWGVKTMNAAQIISIPIAHGAPWIYVAREMIPRIVKGRVDSTKIATMPV